MVQAIMTHERGKCDGWGEGYCKKWLAGEDRVSGNRGYKGKGADGIFGTCLADNSSFA